MLNSVAVIPKFLGGVWTPPDITLKLLLPYTVYTGNRKRVNLTSLQLHIEIVPFLCGF